MIVWMLAIAVSMSSLIVLAALKSQNVGYGYLHMGVALIMAVALAVVAMRHVREQAASGASEIVLSATLARFMGVVWAYGGLALFATYATGIASWKEWPAFLAAFVCLAGVSFFLSWRMTSVATSGGDPTQSLKLSRYLAWGQLIGMIIVMLGLIIDGKMVRFLEDQRPNWQDWAANNYFFFGALSLAILSAYGIFGIARDTGTSAGSSGETAA